jgi:hypothetical protein
VITTRADISYATNIVAAYKRRPSNAHCNAARRIIKYLKGTKHLKITFGGHACSSNLEAYVSSDYGANRDDRKSRIGYILFISMADQFPGDLKSNHVLQHPPHMSNIWPCIQSQKK